MDNSDHSNRILIAIDASNLEYMTMWSAFSEWKKKHKEDVPLWIKPVKETDQDNLPELLNCTSFRRTLHQTAQEKVQRIVWMTEGRCNKEMREAVGIDIFLVEDSPIEDSFRKIKYPEYKAQRKLAPKQFNVFSIKRYIHEVIFKELNVEDRLGFKILKVDGCECDDIIAILMKNSKDYLGRFIFSADHDFLQLEDVKQYDLFGNRVERNINRDKSTEMTPKEFLLWKILRGDTSDNIKNVFKGFGDMKAYKLVKDKDKLKRMLNESQEASERFVMNKFLIDFRSIPEELEKRIIEKIEEKMSEETLRDKVNEFNLNSCIVI